ncbi:MAG: response regulator [Deltaproteobacteria bacterium]|nr:response regulator [Deltaproteobacteria bacterium]OIP66567.1 MAG: DNA-binding response regulator [Nitrospirae bacterium CG2_30_70_394]PIX84278.1 MAG: DNA-binding response regulator [Nitrospirae bacterium CG_4_10_14_3_um_filter_70_108]PJB95773.1 MAG: DNA-binding response regulator [Nitrospirae bacterium CG_4_9_14_0_8_um_filter_70_14]NCP96199.1 response regulator [Deltaproteobacteria bacterium]
MAKTILVVDDEADLVEVVRYNLEQAHYRVVSAASGAVALTQARKAKPDLIVLDIMLPDLFGTEVCRTLRGDARTRAIPILFLSAKGEEVDRIVALELGGDDYLTKPFSPRELVLRVGAILRRTAEGEADAATVVEAGAIRLDAGAHRVWVAGAEVALTATEFRLLETFLRQPGRVFSRDQLLDRVWGITAEVTTRTVDTHINRLRDHLGEQAERVETVRGVGYRLRPEGG